MRNPSCRESVPAELRSEPQPAASVTRRSREIITIILDREERRICQGRRRSAGGESEPGRISCHVAEYQCNGGLSLPIERSEVLFAARKQTARMRSGESVLISYLMAQSRFGEAIALLEPLVNRLPDVPGHRTELREPISWTQMAAVQPL